jgi:uncharacterized phiE125 gp8 family phage protein
MSLKLITAPAETPVDLATAKAHVRVIGTAQDDLITLYLNASTGNLDGKDGILGRCLVTQTWEYALDAFPSEEIKIPLPPLQSVVSIKYLDTDGVEQTLSSARYLVDTSGEPGWVVVDEDGWPETYDSANAVKIRFIAGYGAATAVPAALRSAVLLHTGDLFENRQIGNDKQVFVNDAYDRLTWPYRILSV